jgi:hypothetical protein
MRRDQLEHAIRTACQIIGRREVIVVGSQSILGTFREEQLSADATMSVEIDILPIADDNAETERLADLIEGVAGEFSPFEELHGFSIDGVDLSTSALPTGWRDRLVKVQNANTAAPDGARRSTPAGASTKKTCASPSSAFSGKRTRTSCGTRALRPRRPPDHPRPTAHRGRALRPRGQPGRLLAPVFRPLSREPETNLAKSLAAAGKLDQASAVAIEAEVVARSIAAYYVQKHILVDVAEALACAQMPEQAIAVARSIGERAVSRVAPVLAAAGTHEQAIMVARSITDATWRAEAFTSKKLFGSPFGSW